MLGRLADEDLLANVTFVSKVFSGSLGSGLVYTLSGNWWPTSTDHVGPVLPEARRLLTAVDIQRDALFRLLFRTWQLLSRGWANVLSESLAHRWGVRGLVRDLPRHPG